MTFFFQPDTIGDVLNNILALPNFNAFEECLNLKIQKACPYIIKNNTFEFSEWFNKCIVKESYGFLLENYLYLNLYKQSSLAFDNGNFIFV